MAKDTLSGKQSAFVKEFLVDRNGTQAAIRAGYSAKTANEQAARMLAKVSIKEAVAKGEAKHAESCNVTRDSIRLEYETDRAAARALDNPQLNVSVSATEKIAKMYGLDGVTKLEHSGAIINIEAKDADCG
jgi:phage terminase small subunit